MDLRKTLRKAAELLVELPPTTQEASSSDPATGEAFRLADSMPTAQLLSNPTVTPSSAEMFAVEDHSTFVRSMTTGSSVLALPCLPEHMDVPAIYQKAGVPSLAFGAEEVLAFLKTLPVDLPFHSRQQMMQIMFNTLSKNISVQQEDVVADANAKILAIREYMEEYARKTADYTTTLNHEIAQLQERVVERQQQMETAERQQQQVREQGDTEVEMMQQVVSFFEAGVPAARS